MYNFTPYFWGVQGFIKKRIAYNNKTSNEEAAVFHAFYIHNEQKELNPRPWDLAAEGPVFYVLALFPDFIVS